MQAYKQLIWCMPSQIHCADINLNKYHTYDIYCACTMWLYTTCTVTLLLWGQIKLTAALKICYICHFAILKYFCTSKKQHDRKPVNETEQGILNKEAPKKKKKIACFCRCVCSILKFCTICLYTDSDIWVSLKK